MYIIDSKYTWPCLPRPIPSLHPFPSMWLFAKSMVVTLLYNEGTRTWKTSSLLWNISASEVWTGPVDRVLNMSPKRCQYGHRWGILFRVGVRSLLASSESLDNVHEPKNKRGVKHRVNVEQSKFYLLTYWILLLARPVFFFFFSPASTLGVWPLTWRMWW